MEQEGLARLFTYHGKESLTLLPYLMDHDAGLATIFNKKGAAGLTVWRTVFERSAPRSIAKVEAAIGARIGNGNGVHLLSDEVLDALSAAYREAANTGS